MKTFLDKIKGNRGDMGSRFGELEQLRRQVNAVYGLLADLYGSDKMVLRAGKLNALQLMRSNFLPERVLALQKIVFEDPTLDTIPENEAIAGLLDEIEEEVADIIARRTVESDVEKKINEKLQQRHEDYIREIKMQVIKDSSGPENAQTLKKLAILEKLESKKLVRSAMEVLRPANFDEIIGQERAVKALLSKLASSFPQHILLYGPPGVGKTTAARLALEATKEVAGTPFAKDAPFIEVNGTTLRWDPREITNPLLGSVHDPIYQGARRDLAEIGVPEPKLGLVTDAHGGILFIDEVGELEPVLQNKLLKVLEDKRVYFESPYYDASDSNVPKYIKKLFDQGAPADFILIGATTRDPSDICPAIRSRCAEVYFEPLTPTDIKTIVVQAAAKLQVQIEDRVPDLISQYTIEGRKAISILADAYGLVCYRNQGVEGAGLITVHDIYEVARGSRLTPYVLHKSSEQGEVGKIAGLGVHGFLGSVLEIEAVVFPARKAGQGTIRFNDTAGSMAKDSVFNAASVIRKISGTDLANYDLHVNIVGGGRIDGPSAGVAIFLAVFSALEDCPLPQNLGVTGELSIQGLVRAVGGVAEKLYGASQAGITRVIIPRENERDVPDDLKGVEIIAVDGVDEIINRLFPGYQAGELVS